MAQGPPSKGTRSLCPEGDSAGHPGPGHDEALQTAAVPAPLLDEHGPLAPGARCLSPGARSWTALLSGQTFSLRESSKAVADETHGQGDTASKAGPGTSSGSSRPSTCRCVSARGTHSPGPPHCLTNAPDNPAGPGRSARGPAISEIHSRQCHGRWTPHGATPDTPGVTESPDRTSVQGGSDGGNQTAAPRTPCERHELEGRQHRTAAHQADGLS